MDETLIFVLFFPTVLAVRQFLYEAAQANDQSDMSTDVLESHSVVCEEDCLLLCSLLPDCGDVIVEEQLLAMPILKCHLLGSRSTGTPQMYKVRPCPAPATIYIAEGPGPVPPTDTGWDISHFTGVRFKVMAQRDAYVFLSPSRELQPDKYIAVILGAWTNKYSNIRTHMDSHHDHVKVPTRGILDPNAFRSFWVTWTEDNRTVSVGYGDAFGQDQFMGFTFSQGPTEIKYLMVCSFCVFASQYENRWVIDGCKLRDDY